MSKLILSERFAEALSFALSLHRDQYRKHTGIPYIAHLLGVTSLVLDDGGDEDEAIAALLHDAVEDQGGLKTLNKIRNTFGSNVADIVDGCTDSYEIPKPPWRGRKIAYIEHLKTASKSVVRVSLADKLYNSQSILRSLWQEGEKTWDRFNGRKDGTIWYYQRLLEEFKLVSSSPMVKELEITIDEILELSS
jgi:GTP pyrophosphokinase